MEHAPPGAQRRWRNDHILFPMKFTGVTSMIASRLGDDLAEPALDQQVQDEQVGAQSRRGHDEEPEALEDDVPSPAAERPHPVPRVVVRDRDEERADRSGEIMEPDDLEQERRRRG